MISGSRLSADGLNAVKDGTNYVQLPSHVDENILLDASSSRKNSEPAGRLDSGLLESTFITRGHTVSLVCYVAGALL